MGVSRRPKGDKTGNTSAAKRITANGGKPNVKKATFDASKRKEVGVSDLTLISKVTNEAINDNLKQRFENNEIYTYIGHVLVSVNPFRDLGNYTEDVLNSYKGKNRLEMPPHVFAVAESSYYNMKAYKENQCVIISGESGAGKTEAAKRLMQYIANVSGGTNSSIQKTKDMVLATNPLLESFGNAKTLRNNNSSRFGKYLQLQFNSQGEPVGADITNYLLEKSRVVGQIVNERNFHIFYQLSKGASSTYRQNYGIRTPDAYAYTCKSKCLDVDGIDDITDYADTLKSMNIIGLSQDEQDEIFRMLAAILWTGNVEFKENQDGYAEVQDQGTIDFLAYLLEVEPNELISSITIRILTPRSGEIIESPANIAQATATRDALAKAIYNNLFDWIVERINLSLKARGRTENTIGILDIYGFEIFEKNSFEQLCINYVNEKLQQIFIQLTLKTEQEEYAREKIQWSPIKYFDNKIVCDLIESTRPPGVFSAMKDATKTAHADPAACDRTFMTSISAMSNPHLTPRQGNFIIKHYAGDVSYTVEGITDKNKDQLLKGLLNLFMKSQNKFLHSLFPNKVDQDNRKQPPSAGDKIKASANELVTTLMKAQPSYIRTIKPNENKSPTDYNVPNVLHQIKYLGLQENVRIRRAGFAYRQTFEKFVERFYLLSPQTSYAGDYTWTGDAKSGAIQILKSSSIPVEEYQMGVTKTFIKSPETLFALENMRDRYWHNMAIRIQRAWRAYLRFKVEAATRIQRVWRKKRAGAELLALREKGHKILQGRKERRRFSLLGSRRFMGDYLGVNASSGPGSRIRSSIDLPANEIVLFSCRGEILETKFGRSSKQAPRILLLTKGKFYIVAQQLINKQVRILIERSFSLGAINFIGISTCRDDWFSLGINSPQQPDPLLNCVLKTELLTHIQSSFANNINFRIADNIEYAKKPNKMQSIKVIKDSTTGIDFYKSGAIHTSKGEPPDSISQPLPKGKPVPARPFTKGRLLKPGGPSGRPSRLGNTSRNTKPVPKPIGNATINHNIPNPPEAIEKQNHEPTTYSQFSERKTSRPPPPPPPAINPKETKYRVLYDFIGQSDNEISVRKDELLTVIQKENNGWWLVKNASSQQGWAPTAYLKKELIESTPALTSRPTPLAPPKAVGNGPVVRAKPIPPMPPAKRPVSGRKPGSGQTQRDSAMSINTNDTASGRSTPQSSLAGGLAEALKARQAAMQRGRDEDDNW
ncbi:putative p-loop containing nucleoside triphosphate hydrolase [Erysiphe necator]|uniref:Myosin-1 n=1 Tax=Uncinula necator TaxID=52586 RepID=A0A0B1PHG7_UNCNE|nr:putative p-loop containing nucleoside triphosphate hydrolase [Erysiphe necator]